MRRIALTLMVAILILIIMAIPAFATVHPQSKAECAESAFAQDQNPPGITGQSNADNFAQPVVAQLTNPTANDFHAWKSEECPADR